MTLQAKLAKAQERLAEARENSEVKLERTIMRRYGTGSTVPAKVSGQSRAQRVIEVYEKNGYKLDDLAARKAIFSPVTGVFTNKEIYTLLFRKQ